MRIAIIKKGSVDNIVIGDSANTLRPLFPGFTLVENPPEGTQTGDSYVDGVFGMEGANREPKPVVSLEDIQGENKLLKAQLQAQTERSDFIEDCIAEMATMVYGGV